jgi:glucose-1-phosphate thymidylyltransferase
MKGIVLAGGTGTRLYPLTKVTNKHLLPVYNEPMIFKPIKTLRDSGISDITVVLGGESIGEVVRVLGNGSELGVRLSFVYQEAPMGIADALFTTRDLCAGRKVAVILGDNIYEDTFAAEAEAFEADEDAGCYLFLKEVEHPTEFGVALLDGETVIDIEEKPAEPKSSMAVTGIYFYDTTVFDRLGAMIAAGASSPRGEFEITTLNMAYVVEGKAKAFFVDGFWSDAGTIDTLLATSAYLAGLKRGQG